jgi:hypothetical protein
MLQGACPPCFFFFFVSRLLQCSWIVLQRLAGVTLRTRVPIRPVNVCPSQDRLRAQHESKCDGYHRKYGPQFQDGSFGIPGHRKPSKIISYLRDRRSAKYPIESDPPTGSLIPAVANAIAPFNDFSNNFSAAF